jgi:glycosyltransferase involved in cell wall biosynthesis
MQRTSICYIITKSNFGGAQKYVYELATSLDPEQFEVSVACGGNGALKTKLSEAGIEVIPIPDLERDISITKEFKVFGFLYNLFAERHFDVVHLNSSKIGGLGSISAKIAGVPRIIFTAHGWAFNEDRSWAAKLVIKCAYWITLVTCDKTIAVSEAIKKQIKGWPINLRNVTVIPNGVRPPQFHERSDARDKLSQKHQKLSMQTRWVGTLAELHPIKGLDVLITAAAQNKEVHNDVQYLIFGEGDERARLEKQIRDAGLEDTVILLGYVEDAARYLQSLDMFVLPSRSEALGLVILEAGLARVPIVATRVGGIPEVIADHELGILVEPDDATALAKAVQHIIADPDRAQSAAAALHTRVTKDFSHETMVAKTLATYGV